MTYESYSLTYEEFNPLKKEDWKNTGKSVRRGIGFLTPEEEYQKGKEMVLSHPIRKKLYMKFASEDMEKAHKYIKFWGKHDIEANPVWDPIKKEFIDKAIYTYGTGPGGKNW